MSIAVRYIDSSAALESFCAELGERLRDDPRVAIDTEFIRERTYRPLLEIVQVAAGPEFIALIDLPALNDSLGALAPILLDPDILKIVHAGSQDVEILADRLGTAPGPLFDTQIAASFAGFGLQTGYGALVQSVLGVRLSKEEGFADWSRRPLTAAMRDYAANDVRYLHALHDKLDARLKRRGRDLWASEQTLRTLSTAAETDAPDDLWLKVGGKHTLDSRGLSILRELARWRDDEARRRDKPRRSVIKDEPLIEVARRKPQTAAALLELRGMPPNLGERVAAQLVEQVKKGLAVPEDERPVLESGPPLDDQGAALLELLSAVVRVRAMQEDLPPSLLAASDDLRALAIHRRKPPESNPLFAGWRAKLIGDELRAVLSGEVAVAWDPNKGQLISQRGSPSS